MGLSNLCGEEVLTIEIFLFSGDAASLLLVNASVIQTNILGESSHFFSLLGSGHLTLDLDLSRQLTFHLLSLSHYKISFALSLSLVSFNIFQDDIVPLLLGHADALTLGHRLQGTAHTTF